MDDTIIFKFEMFNEYISSLKNIFSDLKEDINEIESYNDVICNSKVWYGPTKETYIKNYEIIKKSLEAVRNILKNIIKYLEQVLSNYQVLDSKRGIN